MFLTHIYIQSCEKVSLLIIKDNCSQEALATFMTLQMLSGCNLQVYSSIGAALVS